MRIVCLIISIALVLTGTSAFSQQKVVDIDALVLQNNKPVLLYFHTTWCVYCAMQSKSLKNKNREEKLAERYNFIDFDAESDQIVKYNKRTFRNDNPVKYQPHPFVQSFFINSTVGYPAWVLVDKDFNILSTYSGFLSKKQLAQLLK
ncbi:thioredoxin family protein [Pseudopedobacter beijingensis]|uniref:Thioredoxin family protein n=1 Tax=Pseudopedobacter beijingensis TaxID=1207056 RepID=A0ABW4IFV3_9SPHI